MQKILIGFKFLVWEDYMTENHKEKSIVYIVRVNKLFPNFN